MSQSLIKIKYPLNAQLIAEQSFLSTRKAIISYLYKIFHKIVLGGLGLDYYVNTNIPMTVKPFIHHPLCLLFFINKNSTS